MHKQITLGEALEKTDKIGIKRNPALGTYFIELERRIESLESRLNLLINRIGFAGNVNEDQE